MALPVLSQASWGSEEVENHERDIVVVGPLRLGAGPATKLEQQSVGKL